jgi:hypothetical protein
MKQSDWLRAFQTGPVFCMPALVLTACFGFRAKNRGVKQFLNETICQKRLKNIA